MPYSVVLLVDSSMVPIWQSIIISHISKSKLFDIRVVLINSPDVKPSGPMRLVYRALRMIDRALFRTPVNHFVHQKIEDLLGQVKALRVVPIRSRYKDEFSLHDIATLRSYQPDIIIRFGFRILTGDILTVAKYGVWSLHHGDNAVNRGGPPAFWEVVNRDPITGVTLQVLSEKLDAGQVLGKSYCKTDFTSFSRNQQKVYAAGVELFCSRLRDFALNGPDKFFASLPQNIGGSSGKLYRDPGNAEALKIAFRFFTRRLKEFVSRIWMTEQWVLFVKNEVTPTFSMTDGICIQSPNHADFADPFLFQVGDEMLVFFEWLERSSKKGKIAYLPLNALQSEPRVVLEQDHHLSYPFIFEAQDNIYMVPESAQDRTVSLYRATHFPDQWVKVTDILHGAEYFDPTLHFHQGYWYLFVTCRPVPGASTDQFLHIFYSENLIEGPWRPHKKNPVSRDVRGARPAGRVFMHQGKLLRPAQVGTPKYGYAIRFQEIVQLTPDDYAERPHFELVPWQKGLVATHTFNHSNGVTVVDAQRRKFRYF